MNKKGLLKGIACLVIVLLPLHCFAVSLPCVIAHTLKTNPNVLETIHKLESQHEIVKQAQADFYPRVDLNAAYGREASLNSNTNFEWVTLWHRELGVTIRQMLFDGFSARNEEIKAMAQTDANAFEVYAESEDIALAAAEAYINILRDQDFIKVGETNVRNHARLAHMISRRAEQGVGRKSDIYQANTRLAAAEVALQDILRQYYEDKIIFERVTGLHADCLEPAPNPNDLPCDLIEAIKLALCYHPTLKASIASLESARAQHRAAFAPNFPRVDLVIRANSNQDLDGFPGPNRERSALLEMQWNLFRGGKDFALQRETAFTVMTAADLRDQTYRKVVEQISQAWNVLMITKQKAPITVMYRDNAAKTSDAFFKLFMVGRSSLFDLLGVERDRFISAQEFVDNKYSNLIAKYRILNGMGHLNRYLGIPISRHSQPCFRTLERAGSFYGPLEMDYYKLQGGCCQYPYNPHITAAPEH